MPLGFRSLSHGDIAFGFFNVESDMLLLENNFFFADDFCAKVIALEQSGDDAPNFNWAIWHIADRRNMGDPRSFRGEKRDVGFWGELYRQYPFPATPEEFHQNPEGWKTQPEVTRIIAKYGTRKEIVCAVDPVGECLHIGEYDFSYPAFKELIRYVWVGGYPQWLHGVRPSYVRDMKETIAGSEKAFLRSIDFTLTHA